MKYTYFLLITLASCTAVWSKDPKNVDPMWIDMDQKGISYASVEFVQHQMQTPLLSKENSGYYAIINAANLLDYSKKNQSGTPDPFTITSTSYFDHEQAAWPSAVVKGRLESHFHDLLLSSISGGTRISFSELPNNPKRLIPLSNENAVISFQSLTAEEWQTVELIAYTIIPTIVKTLFKESNPSLTQETIKQAFFEASEQLGLTDIATSFDKLIPVIAPEPESAGLGDYQNLTTHDFAEIHRLIKKDTLSPFHKTLSSASICCLEFPDTDNLDQQLINNAQLEIVLTNYLTSPSYKPILCISFEGSWMSCIIEKVDDTKIRLLALDSQNIDRKNAPEIEQIKRFIAENNRTRLTKEKKPDLSDLESLLKGTSDNSDDKTEKINYDAPLAHVQLDEIPSIDQLLGKVPNHIQLVLEQLKCTDARNKQHGTKLKNALLFHGPPGTGKTTLCQRLAREAGSIIIYAGGGDFRNAYQGSAKKLIDALFNKALELIQSTGKRVVILIDEIDGTTSRLEPHNSTQEDNRAVKVMISHMDQHKDNDMIYIMCTTNYPEKIDAAIMRRFTSIPVPLPDYETRERIFRYYLTKHGIEIDLHTDDSVSSEFLLLLLAATAGFSGDNISDIVTNAVQQYKFGLKPEKQIPLSFRADQFDFSNRTIASNAVLLAELPFMPLFHAFDVYEYTLLEQHLYAQCKHQHELAAELEFREWQNDPTNRHTKNTKLWLKAQIRATGGSLWNGICMSFGPALLQTIWKKIVG